MQPLFRAFADIPVVSISDAQRAPLPFANWCGTVYHGLPLDLYPFQPNAGQYLAFLGRVSPEKGVHKAVEIARRLGLPLKVAAKIDDRDRGFYEHQLKPLFAEAKVEFLGEIGEGDKGSFLGDAAALLFPIDWPEPFGLVMIEAMACGTPVVAFRRGAVPEVMRDGVSGYVVDTIDGAVEATARALELPRKRCRAYFEGRFSAPRMANDYVAVYERLLAAGSTGGTRTVGWAWSPPTRATPGSRPPPGGDRLRRDVSEVGHPEHSDDEVLSHHDKFYIQATSSRTDDRTRVLKHGRMFAVFDRHADVQPVGFGEQGVYFDDTRFLSRLELRVGGRRPLLLSSTVKKENDSPRRRSVEPRSQGGGRLAHAGPRRAARLSQHVPLERRLLHAAAGLELQPRPVRGRSAIGPGRRFR